MEKTFVSVSGSKFSENYLNFLKLVAASDVEIDTDPSADDLSEAARVKQEEEEDDWEASTGNWEASTENWDSFSC